MHWIVSFPSDNWTQREHWPLVNSYKDQKTISISSVYSILKQFIYIIYDENFFELIFIENIQFYSIIISKYIH